MAKADINGIASPRSIAASAGAARGAAKPSLDLSLGHIGTTEHVSPADVEVQDIGPFRVVFDYSTMTGKVFTDTSAFVCRADRRAAERKFHKEALRIGRETGFAISMGGQS